MDSLPSWLVPFFVLQHPTDTPLHPDSFPDSQYYNAGKLDIYMVITCMAVMAILRDALRLGIFEPFARWKLMRDLRHKRLAKNKALANGNGHTNGHVANGRPSYTTKELNQVNRSVMRFAEQGWSVVYYSLQWCCGLYVHRNLPTRVLDPVDLWMNYPHIPLAGPCKFYYLTQIAFYLHQVLILNAEARRKDHVQMMMHHIITVILMWVSYYTNFTRVGSLIMVLMDWCDIFLPLAKMMRYIKVSQIATDAVFGWFLVSWLVTRHVLFLLVIKSTVFDLKKHIKYDWAPERGHYWTKPMLIGFCTLLLALQIMQCIWFWMICRVAWRVVSGKGAADERSDDESNNDSKEN